jgi:hypothetical protein
VVWRAANRPRLKQKRLNRGVGEWHLGPLRPLRGRAMADSSPVCLLASEEFPTLKVHRSQKCEGKGVLYIDPQRHGCRFNVGVLIMRFRDDYRIPATDSGAALTLSPRAPLGDCKITCLA